MVLVSLRLFQGKKQNRSLKKHDWQQIRQRLSKDRRVLPPPPSRLFLPLQWLMSAWFNFAANGFGPLTKLCQDTGYQTTAVLRCGRRGLFLHFLHALALWRYELCKNSQEQADAKTMKMQVYINMYLSRLWFVTSVPFYVFSHSTALQATLLQMHVCMYLQVFKMLYSKALVET